MPPPTILLVESSPDNRSLGVVMIERTLPDAAVTAPSEPLALAEELLGAAPDVIVIAEDLQWFDARGLLTAIKRRHPRTLLVVLVRPEAAAGVGLGAGMAIDGVVQKTVAGFLGLGSVVSEALLRAAHNGAAGSHPTRQAADGGHEDLADAALMFAHDLKEPVQQIIRLARHADTHREGSSPGSSLQLVIECAERVNVLLDGMVEYLSLTRTSAPVLLDLNHCVTRALQNLRTAIDEARAEIRIDALPVIHGDERQLSHLFQNLVGNAIKFRGPDPPIVTITVESRDDAWVLAIADNGIGIPERALDRVFELGTRLHTREEYGGSGIGLALCKRIVERHGGRIWAKSQDRGSIFYVQLPRVAPSVAPIQGNLKAGDSTSQGGDDRRIHARSAH